MMECCCLTQAQEKVMMLVGTYTYGGSKGIYSYRFNQLTGDAEVLDSLAMRNPSYLTLSRDGKLVYAVSETGDASASLNIVSLSLDGSMRLLDTAHTEGADPCYVAVSNQIALTANYSGGSMSVFQLSQEGTKAELQTRFLGTTGGPDLTRQEVPHVHCACFTPDGRYVLATDFSADRILSYRLTGQNVAANGIAAEVSADSGPRHLIFSKDGHFAFLMSELSGNVTVFRYAHGRLKKLQEIVSDSVGARGGADIHLSPDGRFLYSSNRLKDEGIAIFSVDKTTGQLTHIGYQPTGAHPRQFNITPNGRFLLCCVRDSDKIQVFRRDMQTGLLTDTHQDIPVSKAVCVQFH
ncbi:MAG: lactonase family protein [Bacteroidaceae bacterium]|nr:lactonase family protein [Bacteroidaceae bacterium]